MIKNRNNISLTILSSNHYQFDTRVYYKLGKTSTKYFRKVTIICPGDNDSNEGNIRFKCFKKSNHWLFRFKTLISLFKITKKNLSEVIIAVEPDSFFIAIIIKALYSNKVIYDAHEFYPEMFSEHFPKVIKNYTCFLIKIFERFLISFADGVITLNPILSKRFTKLSLPSVIIENYPRKEFYNYNLNEEYDTIKFIYLGSLSRLRGIDTLVRALNIVIKKHKNVKVTLIGPFSDDTFKKQILDYINTNKLDKYITILGRVENSKAIKILYENHVGISVLLPENWRYLISIPTKIFEYMLVGLPIISSDFPIYKSIYQWNEISSVIDPYSAKDIAEKMCVYIENSNEIHNLHREIVEISDRYTWENQEESLIKFYRNIVKGF